MNRKKVAVGISGGVDSAVSALLLKEAGFDVVGVHLYCWPPKSEIEKVEGEPAESYAIRRAGWIKKNGCRADEDRDFALKTALELEIPFKVLDFSEEYNQKVIKYFYDEYEAGRTPNPDVMCNSEIKFGLFLDWAMENGFDYIATGHYAKLVGKNDEDLWIPGQARNDKEEIHLMIPADKHKDQTYFLWKLGQKELNHVLFPLGDLKKDEVRKLAEKANLSVAKRKDSQGICFVGNVEAREFLARRLKENPGKVINKEGEVIGTHDGVWFYTIGQRGGWNLTPEAQKKYVTKYKTPVFYIIEKDAEKNVLVVGEADEAMKDSFEASEVNIISDTKWKINDLKVRIRHGGELVGARVEFIDMDSRLRGNDKVDKSKIRSVFVVLDKPMRGVASGQSAVFYSNEGECLGGGVIA